MEERSLLEICLEKHFIPINPVKLHESLGWSDVDQTSLVTENNPTDSLGVPEQLVDIIIPNNLIVIPLPPQKFPINNLIPLISQELVQGLDDSPEV